MSVNLLSTRISNHFNGLSQKSRIKLTLNAFSNSLRIQPINQSISLNKQFPKPSNNQSSNWTAKDNAAFRSTSS
jgi:hypothetical protein